MELTISSKMISNNVMDYVAAMGTTQKQARTALNNIWQTFFALGFCLLSLNTFAVGGIKSDSDDPNYASGASQETFEDLRVKVLGGHIRITRTFTENGWVWNRRWDSLRGSDLK